jgi:hypothetical protein
MAEELDDCYNRSIEFGLIWDLLSGFMQKYHSTISQIINPDRLSHSDRERWNMYKRYFDDYCDYIQEELIKIQE